LQIAHNNEKGSVMIPVLIGFMLLMWSMIPLINNLYIWKSNLIDMEREVVIDNAINSGVALAFNELEENNDFLGNKTYVYNHNTYEIQYAANVDNESVVNIEINVPNLTVKRILFTYDKVLRKIITWEEVLN